MPIQFPDYQRISFDEANPFLTGVGRGQSLAQSFMQFPQDLQNKILANQISKVQAQYAEPMAKEGLTKAQQANLWNPKLWQSEIGLRGAQSGEATAGAGLKRSQSHAADIESAMSQLKLNYLKQMLGGRPGGANIPGNPSMQEGGAQSFMGASAPQQGVSASEQSSPMTPMQGNAPQSGMGSNSPVSQQGASTYGIPTPQPTQQDIANSMLLGMDTFTPRQKQAYQQQQTQIKEYQTGVAESIQAANESQKIGQILSVFNNAMDNTGMKGAFWGTTPSTGMQTLYHPDKSVTNAQIADNAIANMLPGAITDLRAAMGQGQFSVADLKAASQMKFDRAMSDDARRTKTQWVKGVNERFDERAKFLQSMAGNPNSGATKNDADLLWANYQKDFPLINEKGDRYLGQNAKGEKVNLGNWPLYTTPKAVASIKSTGSYKPSQKELNTFMMQYPDGRVLPVKKGQVEIAFRKGARPL